MTFDEAYKQVEFGLELTGQSGHGFHLVDTDEWTELTGICPSQIDHLDTDGKSCFQCKCIHIPQRTLDTYTYKELAMNINSVIQWLNSSMQHNMRLV
jgi:hypothetical protein